MFQRIKRSSFLTGTSGNWRGATFDWLMREDNAVKVFEGQHDDKAKPASSRPDASAIRAK